jgi:glycerol-3-phosphate dehydrogenase
VDGQWEATLVAARDGHQSQVRARAIVNATGPWVDPVRTGIETARNRDTKPPRRTILVKGSHIVVPKLYDGDFAYILQHVDGRVIFTIPFEGAFSLIGTTDVRFDGDPADVEISGNEIDYLCAVVSTYFTTPTVPDDVVWSYAGVRPLIDDDAGDPAAVTRDYTLELETDPNRPDAAPLLSIFGGKITTYRRLAEKAMAALRPFFPDMGADWTASAPLPGGDIARDGFDVFAGDLATAYPELPPGLLADLARRHGTMAGDVIGEARTLADFGTHFGAFLTAREIDYLIDHEWARAPEDVLWRRTKCGLHLDELQRAAVAAYVVERARCAPASLD